MAELPRTAEVVIVGGGAIGTSIAYNLAERGVRDVVVLERELVGSGSTSKAAGGCRVQFGLPIEVQFSLYSLEMFRHFEDVIGLSADFRPEGYLFLLTEKATIPRFRAEYEMQRSLGANVQWLDADQVEELLPGLDAEGVIAATYSPTDGYAGLSEVVQAYAARARDLGVKIVEGVPVTSISVEADRVRGVGTPQGTVSTPVVINAAGPWAAPVAAFAGISVPVFPRHRHIFVTGPYSDVPHPLPMMIDRASGFYCRSEMGSVLMSPGDIGATTEFEVPPVNWDMMEVAVERAVRWLPALEHAGIANAWVGLRPLTPDQHAIVDFCPGVEGFVLALGFCGHGFQHSPAAGKAVAELVVDGKSSFDLTALRLGRFAAGATLAGGKDEGGD